MIRRCPRPARPLPVILVSLLGFVGSAPAVLAEPQFDSWTTENGLPQNSVYDIVQTRDGYLWLATLGGLVRFDGVRFVIFDRSVEGIRSLRVRALREDSQGTLWAATEDGMLIRYRDGRFVTFGAADGLPHTQAFRIDEGADGHLWITWTGAVTRFDGKRGVTYGPGDLPHGVRGHARSLGSNLDPVESKSDIWWSLDAAGLHYLTAGQVRTLALPAGERGAVRGVSADRHGNIWIQTRGGLLKAHPTDDSRYTIVDGLPHAGAQAWGVEDRNGNLWLSEIHGPLYRVRNRKAEAITTMPVLALYEDREGSIWIGTTADGLHRVRDPSVTLQTERDGLSVNWVYSILHDRSGAAWIGTWGGGVNKHEHGRVTTYRQADGLPSDYVTSIYEDREGRLWVGTTGGMSHLDGRRFTRYDVPGGHLSGNVWAMLEDRNGARWFATDRGLLKSEGGRLRLYSSHDGLSHDRTTALFEDRAGALWIGGYTGLTRLENGIFTAYTERDGFVGNQVRAFHEDAAGVLWIGTYDGGLYRFSNNRLTRFTRAHGLHDNGAFQILEDEAGYLWIGCNRGIYRVSRRELEDVAEGRASSVVSLVLGTADGLANLECNGGRQPSGSKAPNGTLWFPTMGGVAVVDPRTAAVDAGSPPVIIEDVRVGGRAVDSFDAIEIPPGRSSIEIRYTAPSFVRPERVRFRYRMRGLDDEWTDAGDRRTARFDHVPAGEYQFVVMAASGDAGWNTQGRSVNVIAHPPLWRTWWFLALGLAASASLVLVTYERRLARVRKDHARQKAFSQQLIDSQERERRRISTEMHDSLGQSLSIIKVRAGLSRQKVGDEQGVGRELDEIVSLADKIDREMKEIAYGLRPYHLEKIGLSKTIERMVKRAGRACEVDFATEVADIDGLFEKGSEINVYRIVQECVSNIIKHSNATRAAVTIERRARTVEIRIEDNGDGFEPHRMDASNPAEAGFGLMNIRERAKSLGGEVVIRSSRGRGTTVIVAFEVAEHHHVGHQDRDRGGPSVLS